MTSNTRFSMAVHIMTSLAYLNEKMSSEQIASSVNTNPVVVRRLLCDLNHKGLIRSDRGKTGGYTLARNPKEISLLDIYRAVMADQELVDLHENPEKSSCPVSCKVREALSGYLHKAQDVYERELKRTMLSDIEKKI